MKYKHIYLILALLGLCSTWFFNIQFFLSETDSSMLNFIAQTGTTFPAKSINADITVVAFAFLAWYIPEARSLKMKHWWAFIPLTFGVALAFAFPLFLYFRACKLEVLSDVE